MSTILWLLFDGIFVFVNTGLSPLFLFLTSYKFIDTQFTTKKRTKVVEKKHTHCITCVGLCGVYLLLSPILFDFFRCSRCLRVFSLTCGCFVVDRFVFFFTFIIMTPNVVTSIWHNAETTPTTKRKKNTEEENMLLLLHCLLLFICSFDYAYFTCTNESRQQYAGLPHNKA